MKLAIALLMLSTLAMAADVSAPKMPALSDHDKYEARTLQLQWMQGQVTKQDADRAVKDAQDKFQALSDKACGKDAMLDLGKTQGAEPSCVPKPTEAAKK